MSPELHQFLRDYARWAYEDGAPSSPVFTIFGGLCTNFDHWLCARGIPGIIVSARKDELFRLLQGKTYPFGGRIKYHEESWEGTCHLNHLRKAWVLEHAA